MWQNYYLTFRNSVILFLFRKANWTEVQSVRANVHGENCTTLCTIDPPGLGRHKRFFSFGDEMMCVYVRMSVRRYGGVCTKNKLMTGYAAEHVGSLWILVYILFFLFKSYSNDPRGRPQSRPVVITIFIHVVSQSVSPPVRPGTKLQNHCWPGLWAGRVDHWWLLSCSYCVRFQICFLYGRRPHQCLVQRLPSDEAQFWSSSRSKARSRCGTMQADVAKFLDYHQLA